MATATDPPALDADMALIDFTAIALSECCFCDKCGQRLEDKCEAGVGLIDFETDSRFDLRDFNELYESNTATCHTLVDIFTDEKKPEENAACEKIERSDELTEFVFNDSLPNELQIPMAPRRIRRPALDLLTGLSLGLTLPNTESLKPSRYSPRPAVDILIEIDDFEDGNKSLSYKEAEDIFRSVFPELEIIPNENVQPIQDECPAVPPNENLQPIQDECQTVPAAEITLKKKKNKRKKKTNDDVEPIVETPLEKPKKQLEASMMPKRKDLSKAGELGTKIQILVNMLAIKFGDNLPDKIEQYSVSYEPSKPKLLTYKAYLAAKSQHFPEFYPAYNEGVILSAGCLPIKSPLQLTLKVKEHDDSEEIEVKITIKQVIRKDDQALDFRWMNNIQEGSPKEKKNRASVWALQMIMNSIVMNQSIRARCPYFIPPEGGPRDLGGGLEMWHGLFQSVTVGWKPFLKIDVKHKAFLWNITIIDYVKTIVNKKSDDLIFEDFSSKWDLINKRLAELRVSISCNNEKRYRQLILNLVNKRPHDIVQQTDNGETINVRDYFLKKKNYEIRYPDLPCLLIDDRGTHSYVPMELCTVEDEKSFKWSKLSEKHLENLYKFSITDAKKRRRRILYVFNRMNKERDACLKGFDVSVSREFEKVEARILEAPTLYFYQNQEVKPEDGAWNIGRFQYPTNRLAMNYSWALINLSSIEKQFVCNFSILFIKEASKLGLIVGMPNLEFREPITNFDMIPSYLQVLKNMNVQLVVVVIPDRSKELYYKIKQVSELNIGILTQCVSNTTIQNTNEETMTNIVMKVNAKLQGVNYSFVSTNSFQSRLRCLLEPCMILGADVTHSKSKSEPSIAALVASYDPHYFQYNVEMRFQPPGVEFMDDLEEMMRKQLVYFYGRNGFLPRKIIFYRDGVGEGEFVHVMNKELVAIRRACMSLDEIYQPPVTFMIVQKRINTRLFPLSDKDIGSYNYNVKVGTVIDTVITHPTDIDFILVSHQCVKGTTNPTKYRCLWDESNMSEDELEQLTYYLCHIFARCSKSVKYPAPTYYAHIAATRARVLTQGMHINLNDLSNEQIKLTVHKDLTAHSPMFFL